MPSIELDPLLRPDFSPLCSFDAQLSEKHESNRFHVLQSGDSFYLRLENHPDWLAIYDDPGAQLLGISRSGDEEHFEFSLRRALDSRSWGRVLSLFDGEGKLWRVAWKGKSSFLMRPDSGEAVAFESGGHWKRGAWIQPGAHFEKAFAREWKNSTFDVQSAKSFLESDDEARRLWGLEWAHGSWAEMKSVLRAAATVEHEFGERVIVQSRPIYSAGSNQIGFGSNAPQSGRLVRLIEALQRQNVAVLRDKSKLRKLAPRPFTFSSGAASWPELRVEIDEPSEHEKLEARLNLRDWLRENAADLLDEWDD